MTVKSKVVHNEVSFEIRSGYLYARITGHGEDLETTRATWQKVASECKARGQVKVLIHEEIIGELPFMEQYAFADGLSQLGFDGITVAFVDSKPEQFTNNKFAEDVAVNRGAHGRMFASVADAEAWLKST
ncbi:MAG TPA: hypothetical protein VK629_05875 [Steroidobacteraceae bacterium]|nr:hypothetical protein [Steroidobacteraceae bacterium]